MLLILITDCMFVYATTNKQHAIVTIQLNIGICPTYPEKCIRDNVTAQFSLLSGCNCHSPNIISQ